MIYFFKKTSLFLYASVILFFSLSAAVATAIAKDGQGDLKFFTLDNGLQIIIDSNNRAPVVKQTIWYKVGGMDEPAGKSGIAHILEHLMFKGTIAYPDDKFSRLIAKFGGKENASTSYDYTNYYQTISSDHLHAVIKAEADRMRNLQLNEDIIAPEIDVVHEERLSRIGNSPQAHLMEKTNTMLFKNHPYRLPLIGWSHEILAQKQNLSGILDFYKKYYVPNNAILVISGDVDVEKTMSVIKKTYGRIKKGPDIHRPIWVEPPNIGQSVVRLGDKNVTQEMAAFQFLVPSFGYNATMIKENISAGRPLTADNLENFENRHILPLLLLAEILSDRSFSLYQNLVTKNKDALDLYIYYYPYMRGPGRFSFYIYPNGHEKTKDIATLIRKEITHIVKTGISDKVIMRAKQRLIDARALGDDNLGSRAMRAARAMIAGLSLDEFLNLDKKLMAITPAELHATLHHFFLLPDGGENNNEQFIHLPNGIWAYLESEK